MINPKKTFKVILIVSLSAIILLCVILFLSIRTIDNTPYFQTDYYKKTIARLNSGLADRININGKFEAGFSRINITPKIREDGESYIEGVFDSIRLAGYGDGQYADGVHDSVFVKAIAIQVEEETLILVSADLLLIPPEVVKIINKKFSNNSNVSRQNLFFGATHTHASVGNSIPSYVGEEFEGEYKPEVVGWLADRFELAIKNALIDLKDSKFASGFIHTSNLVANRIIGSKGRLNDKLTLASFKQINGRTAVIGIFAAHATTLGAWNSEFSGDYPGYFQRALERQGIDLALFFSGTAGSHTNRGVGSKFAKSEYIGKTLADSAEKAILNFDYSENINLQMISSEIEIPELQIIYISDGLRVSSYLGEQLMPSMNNPSIQALMLNDLLWITMPCELSGEYAVDLKNALELKGINSAITSFNGHYLGYVVPAKYYYFDHYESRLMGWFGPSFGDYIMELNYTIADSLTGFKL